MFERFTDRARRATVLAQDEARALQHNYIGTEHILLGLLKEGEGVAAQALKGMNISVESLRIEVEKAVGQGAQPPSGHIPYTPRGKKVLELALREALQLGHNYIGTEHILLGLIREGEGIGAQCLIKSGADLNRVRMEVLQLLAKGTRVQGGTTVAATAVPAAAQTQFNCPSCGATLQARMHGLISREEVEDAIRKNNEALARAINSHK